MLAFTVAVADSAVWYNVGFQHASRTAIKYISEPVFFLTNGDYTVSAYVARRHALEWKPKIGDRVATFLKLDGHIGDVNNPRIATITNMVYVGANSQSGWLVYGDGLPGVDSSWVKPAP